MALTVDTITGGNRERDLRTGFTSPPKLTLASLLALRQTRCGASIMLQEESLNYPTYKIM